MGFRRTVRKLLGRPTATFSSPPPRPIDQVIFAMSAASGRVTRDDALSVPAMLRGRNLLCSISTLPLVQLNARNERVRNPLLEQLDIDVPNVVTLAMTLEDLVFEGVAWWQITAQDFGQFPVNIRHLPVGSVSLLPPAGYANPLPSGLDPHVPVVYVNGEEVAASRVIRFDSPNPPVLKAAGRAIRRAILMDRLAATYANNPRPLDYFTPAEGADEVSDDEVADILAEWQAERKRNGTAYIPAALKYNSVDSPSPADMQLAQLQEKAGLAIANALGIDPEELGISTTSRTYTNAVDRRRDRINDVLSPYMRAITDRLSMGDITRRGHRVVFDLDDYMRANPTERVAYYQAMKDMDAMTSEEIRDEEELPPLPPGAIPTPPPVPVDPAATEPVPPAGSTAPPVATFDAGPQTMNFDLPVQGFRVDTQRRIIEGVALPYGQDQVATKYGLKYRFVRGALQWSSVNRVKLLRDHNIDQPIGVATNLTDLAAGLGTRFKVAKGAEGDAALSLADDGVLDGLSVGVDFDMATDVYMDDDGVMNVTRATLREVSLTAMPAFDDARVTKVAASRARGNTMPCSVCGQVHAEGVACTAPTPTPPAGQQNGQQPAQQPAAPGLQLSDDQLRALVASPAALAALTGVPAAQNGQQGQQQQAQQFTLTSGQIDALAAGGHLRTLLGIGAPAAQPEPEPARQVVDPTRRLTASVREELPYRFDRKGNLTRGVQYDFSTDVIAGLRDGDREALSRAEQFVQSQFAAPIDTTDAGPLNPNRQRPDLYVDQKSFTYPIWDTINKGTIADATPFVLPKFSASSGLVADHVQDTEPGVGDFTATSQTITPSAVSGKVRITREAWDQGGNPQLSGLVWNQMIRAWYESLEAAAVTMLNGLAPTTITLTTAAVDSALAGQLEAALAALQYVRGGFRMRDFFVQVDLYSALTNAKDTTGRKLYPVLGPQNATGTTSDFFGDISIGGLRGRPAWALAASGTVAAKSYLFDRADVSGWATAPNRLTFEQIEVRAVYVGIWGYKALANTDLTGVRVISYDPSTL